MYPSFQQIIIILVILLLLFGHKKIRAFGKSLGEALRDFRKGLEGKDEESPAPPKPTSAGDTVTDPSSAGDTDSSAKD